MKNLDRQVVAPFPEQLLGLLLEDDPGPVVRVDDVVADLEGDQRRLYLEVGNRRPFQYLLC
jgi:hypothetical protein